MLNVARLLLAWDARGVAVRGVSVPCLDARGVIVRGVSVPGVVVCGEDVLVLG